MSRRRMSQARMKAEAEQKAKWREEVRIEQEWERKPRAERVRDCHRIIRYFPEMADQILKTGHPWITTALGYCDEMDALAAKQAAERAKHPHSGNPEDMAVMQAAIDECES